jgi:hypothetical protein
VLADSVGRAAAHIGLADCSTRCGFHWLTCLHGSGSPGPTLCCGCSKRFPERRS